MAAVETAAVRRPGIESPFRGRWRACTPHSGKGTPSHPHGPRLAPHACPCRQQPQRLCERVSTGRASIYRSRLGVALAVSTSGESWVRGAIRGHGAAARRGAAAGRRGAQGGCGLRLRGYCGAAAGSSGTSDSRRPRHDVFE